MIIPPFVGVRLIECRDRIELAPVYSFREFVGLGRIKVDQIDFQPGDELYPMFHGLMGDHEIWVIATWRRIENGEVQGISLDYLDPAATEAEALKVFEQRNEFLDLSKEELEGLAGCIAAKEEDSAYIENRFAISDGPPDPRSIEEYDLHQARLKVLAGMQPRTVALMQQAYAAKDPAERLKIERELVESYFAEMAHYWTEDLVRAWQRSNPIGTEWMCEFARVMQEPKREVDPINHELVLNWLRRKYKLLTAEELSDQVLIMTGQRLMPGTLKKRRERLGLTTKRPPGPRPNQA